MVEIVVILDETEEEAARFELSNENFARIEESAKADGVTMQEKFIEILDKAVTIEEGKLSPLELSAPAEREKQGWSMWDAVALGINQTIIPQIGSRLIAIGKERKDEALVEAGAGLRAHLDTFEASAGEGFPISEDDWSTHVSLEKRRLALCEEAFFYLADHPEVLDDVYLDDEHRFLVKKSLGDMLVGFGNYELHGYPANFYPTLGEILEDEDDTDAKFSLWAEECRKAGELLISSNTDVATAMTWLSKWSHDLWD